MNAGRELTVSAAYSAAALVAFVVVGSLLANVHDAPAGEVGFFIGLFFVWPWFAVGAIPGLDQFWYQFWPASLVVGVVATYLWAFCLVSLIRFVWRRRQRRET